MVDLRRRPATGAHGAVADRATGIAACFRGRDRASAAAARAGSTHGAGGRHAASRPPCTSAPTCSPRPARPCPRRSAARVVRTGDRELVLAIELDDGPIWIRIAGVDPAVEHGRPSARGRHASAPSAAAAALPPHVHVQLCVDAGSSDRPGSAPALAGRGAWLALCPDPSPLLGVRPSARRPAPTRPALRRAATGRSPRAQDALLPPTRPQIERGWRHHLFDTDGRAYLDMVNNVAVLGHAHPRLAEAAVARQLRLLNTNSRFHYERDGRASPSALAALASRRRSTPCSSSTAASEANDLALRLARAATGRADVVAVREAYHGWTIATDAVSTSLGRQPARARDAARTGCTRSTAPNTLPRRRTAAPDAGARYAADVARACAALRRRPGAAGGLHRASRCTATPAACSLPDGYLRAVYARGARGRRALHRRRGAGRLRPARRALVLGLRAAGRRARHRHGRQGDGQRPAARRGDHHPRDRRRLRRRGLASSPRSGGSPVSCAVGLRRARRDRRRGAAGERRATSATHLRARLERARRAPSAGRRRARHGPLPGRGARPRPRDAASRRPRRRTRSASGCASSASIVQPTGDRHERAQDQAAAVPHAGERRLLRRRARPGAAPTGW